MHLNSLKDRGLLAGRINALAITLSATAAVTAVGGCAHPLKPDVMPPDPPSIRIVDAAMAQRDWPQSTAQWSNAKLVGWPTRFDYDQDPTKDRKAPIGLVRDEFYFAFQTFRLPFTYLTRRPFQRTLWDSGVAFQPTYTAMPGITPPPPYQTPATIAQEETERPFWDAPPGTGAHAAPSVPNSGNNKGQLPYWEAPPSAYTPVTPSHSGDNGGRSPFWNPASGNEPHLPPPATPEIPPPSTIYTPPPAEPAPAPTPAVQQPATSSPTDSK